MSGALKATECLSGATMAPGTVEETVHPNEPTVAPWTTEALSVNEAPTPTPTRPRLNPSATNAAAVLRMFMAGAYAEALNV
jgi:hypothetical protein